MTRAEIRAYVLARLSLSSTDTARVTSINTLIDQVYLRLAGKYRLKKATSSLTFTAGTATVTLPSDLMEILSIQRGTRSMQPIDEDRFAQLVGQEYQGVDPVSYYRVDLPTIRVVPTPQTTNAAAATLHYVQAPTTLATGGDSASPASLPTQFHDLIAELVIAQVAMDEEEFGGHMAAASATASRLEGELALHMNVREGAGTHRVLSARYG